MTNAVPASPHPFALQITAEASLTEVKLTAQRHRIVAWETPVGVIRAPAIFAPGPRRTEPSEDRWGASTPLILPPGNVAFTALVIAHPALEPATRPLSLTFSVTDDLPRVLTPYLPGELSAVDSWFRDRLMAERLPWARTASADDLADELLTHLVWTLSAAWLARINQLSAHV